MGHNYEAKLHLMPNPIPYSIRGEALAKLCLQPTMTASVRFWLSVALVVAAIKFVSAIPLEDFYPFGFNAGGTVLNSTDDGSSGIVTLHRVFPFFGIDHLTVVVSQVLFPPTSYQHLMAATLQK